MGKAQTLRVGVVSDSHGDRQRLFLAARRLGRVDALCFLGDITQDADYLRTEMDQLGRHAAFFVVRGNNDFSGTYPAEILTELGGKRWLLTHGHLWGVKQGLTRLCYHAAQERADIVLFGHTHIPYSGYEGGVFYLNPGAASFRRPQCAVLSLTDGKTGLEMLDL